MPDGEPEVKDISWEKAMPIGPGILKDYREQHPEEAAKIHRMLRQTHAYQAALSYFYTIYINDGFRKYIKDIRKNHGIPIEGGFPEDADISQLEDDDLFFICIALICAEYNLPTGFYNTVRSVVLWDGIVPPDPFLIFLSLGDALDEALFRQGKEAPHKTERFMYLFYDYPFPITLHISPYASLRDIQEYLRICKPLYAFLQEKRGNKKAMIGKRRPRRKDESILRDEIMQFIYVHRENTPRHLAKMIFDEFKGEIWAEEEITDARSKVIKEHEKLEKNIF